MIGIAAPVGVVAADRDLTLVVDQRIQHMESLARGCGDQLGEVRPIAA